MNYSYDTQTTLTHNGGLPMSGRGVFVGQFTIRRGEFVMGSLLTVGTGTSASPHWYFEFLGAGCVPAPGAAAIFGLAAFACTRRRHARSGKMM